MQQYLIDSPAKTTSYMFNSSTCSSYRTNKQWQNKFNSSKSYKKHFQQHLVEVNVKNFDVFDYDDLNIFNRALLYTDDIKKSDTNAIKWKQWAQTYLKNHPNEKIPLIYNNNRQLGQKPKTAFKLFKLEHIVNIKNDHPDYGFKERLQLLKQMWKELPKKQKYNYVTESKLRKEQGNNGQQENEEPNNQ